MIRITIAVWLTMFGMLQGAEPNVVMIIGDDQGWDDYGFMGSKIVRTPQLDRLASQSLVFPRGYVPSSLCRPSLASMVTGLFPHQHFIMSNDPPYPPNVPPAQRMKNEQYLNDRAAMVARFEKSPSLAKLLSSNGYVSYQAGKWWEGNSCRCGGFSEGMTIGDPSSGGRHGDIGLTIGREGLMPVFNFLEKVKTEPKPFFLWYSPMMPHSPHNPPERILKRYRSQTESIHMARYWAMCEWFDETVGDLLKKLDENGQSENTIVIYLHDNGWIQDPTSPQYAPKSKQSPYDGGLRTPIMIRWPSRVTPAISQELAHSIDLVPTILNAVDVKQSVSKSMTGINLLDPSAAKKRNMIFGEIYLHTAKDLNSPKANLRYRWSIRDQWKVIVPDPVNSPDQSIELYDLKTDPKEQKNVSKLVPKIADEMSKSIDGWFKP